MSISYIQFRNNYLSSLTMFSDKQRKKLPKWSKDEQEKYIKEQYEKHHRGRYCPKGANNDY